MPRYYLKLSKRLDHRVPYGLTLTQVSARQNDMVWVVLSQEVRPNAKTCVIRLPGDLPIQGKHDTRMLTLHYHGAPRLVDRMVLATEVLDDSHQEIAPAFTENKAPATILDFARKGMNLFRLKGDATQSRHKPTKATA